MDRRVTPPKRVTSPTWGVPPPCKQAAGKFKIPHVETVKHFTNYIPITFDHAVPTTANRAVPIAPRQIENHTLITNFQ